jgi:hypothetical protein
VLAVHARTCSYRIAVKAGIETTIRCVQYTSEEQCINGDSTYICTYVHTLHIALTARHGKEEVACDRTAVDANLDSWKPQRVRCLVQFIR